MNPIKNPKDKIGNLKKIVFNCIIENWFIQKEQLPPISFIKMHLFNDKTKTKNVTVAFSQENCDWYYLKSDKSHTLPSFTFPFQLAERHVFIFCNLTVKNFTFLFKNYDKFISFAALSGRESEARMNFRCSTVFSILKWKRAPMQFLFWRRQYEDL